MPDHARSLQVLAAGPRALAPRLLEAIPLPDLRLGKTPVLPDPFLRTRSSAAFFRNRQPPVRLVVQPAGESFHNAMSFIEISAEGGLDGREA